MHSGYHVGYKGVFCNVRVGLAGAPQPEETRARPTIDTITAAMVCYITPLYMHTHERR